MLEVSNFLMAIRTKGNFSSFDRKVATVRDSIRSTSSVSTFVPREWRGTFGSVVWISCQSL